MDTGALVDGVSSVLARAACVGQLALGLTVFACSKQDAPPPAVGAHADGKPDKERQVPATDAPGYIYTDPAGFRVWFPSEPTVDKSQLDTDGGPVAFTTVQVIVGDASFILGYGEYSREVLAERSVPYMLDEMVSGTSESAEEISLEGHPGIAWEQELTIGDVPMKRRMRAYLIGTRAVTVTFGAPIGAYQERGDRFLASLALVEGIDHERTSDLTRKPWARYRHPDGLVEVEAPGPLAEEHRQAVPIGDGQASGWTGLWGEGMYSKYTITVLTIPEELLASFDAKAAIGTFERVWTTKWDGKRVQSKATAPNELRLAFQTEEQGNLIEVRGLVHWRAPNLYQVITRRGAKEEARELRFFESLRFQGE